MLPQAEKSGWNYASAAHLLNRAGFGAPPREIEAAVKAGRAATIARLLKAPAPVADPSFASTEKLNAARGELALMSPDERRAFIKETIKKSGEDLRMLRGFWIDRMLQPEAAGVEKAVLFWHGHFATSVVKVKNPTLMWKQNQLFRKYAFGDFRDMVKAISCDPAMVLWLDLQQSRSGAPNENFARELMELFTLGIGNYTEDDIKASARAFTGYRTQGLSGTFDYVEQRHDDSEKVFMGKRGQFSGDDIIDLIFAQPACAEFICRKIWTFYAYEEPEPVIVKALADTFRKAKFQLRPVFDEMLNSRAFYSAEAMGTQIKSPVQFIVQGCRELECDPPAPVVLQQTLRGTGQLLFAPPNVKGWDGNRAWINTATLADRVEFTDTLVSTSAKRRLIGNPLPVEKLVTDEMINNSALLIDGLATRLLSVSLDQATRADLIAEAETHDKPLSRSATLSLIGKMLRLPEYQLV